MPKKATSPLGYRAINEILGIVFKKALESAKEDLYQLHVDFINDVYRGTYWKPNTYPNFTKAFRPALLRAAREVKEPLRIVRFQNGILTGKTSVLLKYKNFSKRRLDRSTGLQFKRDLKGTRRIFRSDSRMKDLGWWRFFEYGSSQRNWGSETHAFVPASRARVNEGAKGPLRGGLMVPLNQLADSPAPKWRRIFNFSDGKKFKPHPGVIKLGMFTKTWTNYTVKFKFQIPAIMKKHMNKVAAEQGKSITIDVLRRRGMI